MKMKNWLYLLLVALSANVWAEEVGPKIYYGSVSETTGSTGTFIPMASGETVLNQKFCWLVEGVTDKKANKVTEVFQTPTGGKFIYPDAKVVSNADASKHVIRSAIAANPAGQYIRCWGFDETDPTGRYSVEVAVGKTKFPPFSFQVKR